MLLPVLDQLIQSSTGKVDTNWWNRICHYIGGGSGPTWLSGWATVFTIFNDKSEWVGECKLVESYNINGSEITDWLFIETKDLPNGYVSVPVIIDDNGKQYKTTLYAGHITSNIQSSTISPRLDWLLTLK
ncbi:hypothetical protein DLAC_11716 [Tieghemostelium lacteum]|uniref:Uncharacterized protein n=1 Tax=Tieghemostelium lacteum TaxID=361077 RepID=A0A151ZC12_TIELA|nr:hypothetical protein DLAC_11716 [Tieghemostelium lacteum]|eukprot:KYQ91414.1 hypothetical protein DLAC_11716 [Tieghemostelium lacteum]